MQRKDTHSLWIDLTIFSCVFVFFLLSGKRLFRHQDINHKTPGTSRGPAEDLEKNDSRIPASLQTGASREAVLEVGCLPTDANQVIKTNFTLVRLKGDLCEKGKKIIDGSAINEANGAEINAFVDHLTKKMATNYFPLQTGKNTILLEFILANGKRQKTQLEIEKL